MIDADVLDKHTSSRQGAHSLGQCECMVDLVRLFRLPTLYVSATLQGLIEKCVNGYRVTLLSIRVRLLFHVLQSRFVC